MVRRFLTLIYGKQFFNNSFGFRTDIYCEQVVIKDLKFFDEVNQDKLMKIIHRTIKDDGVI